MIKEQYSIKYNKIYISLDNAPINKNNITINGFYCILECGSDIPIHIIYKIPCHSKCICDSHFGVVKKHIKEYIGNYTDIKTINQFQDYLDITISNTISLYIEKEQSKKLTRNYTIKIKNKIENVKKIAELRIFNKKNRKKI